MSRWSRRKPEAYARLEAARTALAALSEQISVPVENIVTPEIVRRICWDWDGHGDVDEQLAGHGARPWQRQLTVPLLTEALAD
ncbi:ribonuclease III [Mycobacteroides abscessus subsp. abscessus]|nr:ribonuclease III [Mycobacteroides abscessus subsp. abscessus]